MRTYLIAALAAVVLAGCASPSEAQTAASPVPAAPAPCSAPEFAQMDFWLGDWDASFEGGQGINRVTKMLEGCVVQEAFEGDASTSNLRGHSVSIYQPAIGQWRQTWVDNQGAYYALTGGRVGDDFVLTNTRLRDNAPYARMVFEDIEADSFTWRWQSSADAGVTWTNSWVIYYRRRASAH